MKKSMKTILGAALVSSLVPFSGAWATDYEIDSAHASADFSVKHLMVSNVKGHFSNVTGKVSYDPANVAASKVEASIDVATVDTRNSKRDDHLKSPDFFDAGKFNVMTFKSTKVEPAGAGKLKVTGDLTIHGVTKPVVLDVEGPSAEVKDPWGNIRRGVSASTTLNRKDFGLTWNKALETGGVVVGEEVSVTLDLEVMRKG